MTAGERAFERWASTATEFLDQTLVVPKTCRTIVWRQASPGRALPQRLHLVENPHGIAHVPPPWRSGDEPALRTRCGIPLDHGWRRDGSWFAEFGEWQQQMADRPTPETRWCEKDRICDECAVHEPFHPECRRDAPPGLTGQARAAFVASVSGAAETRSPADAQDARRRLDEMCSIALLDAASTLAAADSEAVAQRICLRFEEHTGRYRHIDARRPITLDRAAWRALLARDLPLTPTDRRFARIYADDLEAYVGARRSRRHRGHADAAVRRMIDAGFHQPALDLLTTRAARDPEALIEALVDAVLGADHTRLRRRAPLDRALQIGSTRLALTTATDPVFPVTVQAGTRKRSHLWRPASEVVADQTALCGASLTRGWRQDDPLDRIRCDACWTARAERSGNGGGFAEQVGGTVRVQARGQAVTAVRERVGAERVLTHAGLREIVQGIELNAAARALAEAVLAAEEDVIHRTLGPTAYWAMRERAGSESLAGRVPATFWSEVALVDQWEVRFARPEPADNAALGAPLVAALGLPDLPGTFRGKGGRPSWDEHFAAVEAYLHAHGELPGRSYVTAEGIRAGAWLRNQRTAARGTGDRTIRPDRRARLDALAPGWSDYRGAGT